MITKTTARGQHNSLLTNTGFSMVETIIVAGILAALSLFAMEMLDRQTRMLKTVEHKFSLQSVHAQITKIISSSANCKATLASIDPKAILLDNPSDSTESIIDSIQKEFSIKVEDEIESELREVYAISTTENKLKYEGISIQRYSLSLREDNFIEEDSLTATASFNIHYDLGPNTIGGRFHRKSINISLKFEEEDPNTLSSCHGENSAGSGGSIATIDPLEQSDLSGLSGNEACQNLGKTCIQVISLNYASKAFGQIGIGNLCQINYNQPLDGVKQGSPVSNIHSCEAKIGQFETYKIEQTGFGVTCQGIFKAQCQ